MNDPIKNGVGNGVYDYALYWITLSPIEYGVNRGFKGLINLTLKDWYDLFTNSDFLKI